MKKIISKTLGYLLEKGFTLNSDIIGKTYYTFLLTDDKKNKITISIDIRECFVDLKIKKGTKVLLDVESGNVMENYEFHDLYEMLSSVNGVYCEAKVKFKGFSKKHIEKILKLYFTFILKNIEIFN